MALSAEKAFWCCQGFITVLARRAKVAPRLQPLGTCHMCQETAGPFIKRSASRKYTVGSQLWNLRMSEPASDKQDVGTWTKDWKNRPGWWQRRAPGTVPVYFKVRVNPPTRTTSPSFQCPMSVASINIIPIRRMIKGHLKGSYNFQRRSGMMQGSSRQQQNESMRSLLAFSPAH